MALRHDGRARLKLLLLDSRPGFFGPGALADPPRQAGPHRRSLPARRRRRRPRAPHGAEALRDLEGAGDRREQARRERPYRRRLRRRSRPPDGRTLLMSSTASLTEKNVDQFAPGDAGVGVALRCDRLVENSRRVDTDLISSPAATPASYLRLFRHRRRLAPLGRAVQIHGEGRPAARPLQGHRTGRDRPPRRPDRPPVRARARVLQHVRAGKLKALATTGAQRAETMPDLPTVAESGLPGYEAVGWFGLLAPAATPKPFVERLSADANRVLADRDVRTRMQALGADPPATRPRSSRASSATTRRSGRS